MSINSAKYQKILKKIPRLYLRPKNLAWDNVADTLVLKYELRKYKNIFLDYFNSRGSKFTSRQKLGNTYTRNGAIYFFITQGNFKI